MFGDRKRTEEFGNGLGGEVDFGYLFPNDASDDFATKWNENDLAWLEGEIGGVGERAAATAIDFCRHHLIKHGFIIAYVLSYGVG